MIFVVPHPILEKDLQCIKIIVIPLPPHNRAFPLETNKYQGGNYTAIHNTGSVNSYHLALAQ